MITSQNTKMMTKILQNVSPFFREEYMTKYLHSSLCIPLLFSRPHRMNIPQYSQKHKNTHFLLDNMKKYV